MIVALLLYRQEKVMEANKYLCSLWLPDYGEGMPND